MAGRIWSIVAATMIAVVVATVPAAYAGVHPMSEPELPNNVKYYVVQPSYLGQPENLNAIAQRFLGGGERSGEIFDLNRGRVQADGGQLTDPTVLRVGWSLVLPWDAIGAGVQHGPLPTATVPATVPSTSPPTASPPASPAGPTVTGSPTGAETTGPAALGSDSSVCVPATTRSAAGIPWPQLRLAPDQAWGTTRGDGVTVAILDSTVDGSAPALAGRVLTSIPIGTGLAPAPACPDHGTALTALLAAAPTPGRGLVGIAAEVTVLPIVVDHIDGLVPPAQVAAGLAAAAQAGAGIAMIGAPVDLGEPAVAAAIVDAIALDVVVVVGASASGGPGAARPGMLRVGAVAADDSLAQNYPVGTVDVVAPGAGVITLAGSGEPLEGSGTAFAVPFVAGLVALLRAAAPDLSAAATAQHVKETADRATSEPPTQSPYGWGMISFSGAFAELTSAQPPVGDPAGDGIDGWWFLAGAVAVTLGIGLLLWIVVLRRTGPAPA